MSAYRLGLDVGSTTVKVVLLDESNSVFYCRYRRHKADVRGELTALMEEMVRDCGDLWVSGAITGSGGLTVAALTGLPFIQEVVTETEAVRQYAPRTDVIIELGGEDAKITYLKPTLEQRMNGTCAGGTGAFIDQMATLLNTDAGGLNDLASKSTTIYPIAARCGVFAKTDVQPLINDGADRADIAASILQAVVNQTISGLACGRPIRGNVAFLGGPLHYLPQLRKRFIDTLGLTQQEAYCPENGHLFVAAGAALLAPDSRFHLSDLPRRMRAHQSGEQETRRLAALFRDEHEYAKFVEKHNACGAQRAPIEQAEGPCFLGIDAGSTTLKAVLLDEKERVLYTFYRSNEGRPLEAAQEILADLYSRLPDDAWIAGSCATGYGENLLKAAFHMDCGEVETVAHFRAARKFQPNVDFIIDIGGQDMKCMRIRDGVIDDIMLNEACSSGCGSFLETFARSLDTDIRSFAQEALFAAQPVDLGTRCTVFMNSRVKQAQKEGAGVDDISAGLAYSVVRNALYKVVKVKDAAELGENVVVQGGTFRNDAVLRAFEKELGRTVVRPDIAEIMGAYGAALLAKDRMPSVSSVIDAEQVKSFSASAKPARCGGCENRCLLTVTSFADGTKSISGNRCERAVTGRPRERRVNLVEYKLNRTFGYEPLPLEEASRGVIGLPRALNMYEDYPFWFTLLTKLGFRVELSDETTHATFERGLATIPSESVCYPAKLAHGHVGDLLDRGIRRILFPCVPYEEKEYDGANNHYNCPIVTSYPEVLRHNMDELNGVDYMHFFFAMDERRFAPKVIESEFSALGVTRREAEEAVKAAYAELDAYHEDIRRKGRETVEMLEREGRTGIVLSGRPYQLDPEISHGLAVMIESYGFDVLTEDSVAPLGALERPIRVLDQWAFHTRVYEAAAAVAKHDCLEVVSVNSFGCGLDAIVLDQMREILQAAGKTHTILKIDEISNMGAVRIRLRSLIAALDERKKTGAPAHPAGTATYMRRMFTKEMRKRGTVVCPQLAPLQFQFLKQAFEPAGYNFDVLTEVTKEDIDVGLKYVNNDACYPTVIIVGQLVNAFLQGRLDPDRTTIMLTQTGGGCRASNYIAFLRKALQEAGYPQVVVASINFAGLEKNPGFRFTGGLALRLLICMSMGDLLQKVMLATRPYEKKEGETNALADKWVERIKEITEGSRYFEYRRAVQEMVDEFDAVERTGESKPKVGLVGEILVKYHPDANNHAIETIEREGGECVLPALTEFMTYGFHSAAFAHEHLGKSGALAAAGRWGIQLLNNFRKPVRKALENSTHFAPFPTIDELADEAHDILCEGHCTGEGWFLTAEMLHLIHDGTPNIICVQPFACMPNHVVGKGMLRPVRARHPEANIVVVDYDPGASEVNQMNRIKLMMHTAHMNHTDSNRTIRLWDTDQADARMAAQVLPPENSASGSMA